MHKWSWLMRTLVGHGFLAMICTLTPYMIDKEGKTSSAILAQKWFKIEGPECRQCITAAARLVKLEIESNCLQLLIHIRPFYTSVFSKKQVIYKRFYAIISVDDEHLNQYNWIPTYIPTKWSRANALFDHLYTKKKKESSLS